MSKISFMCEEESVDLFVKILQKLERATTSLKIRIGGDEHCFCNGIDGLCDVAVDDNPYIHMSVDQRTNIENARATAIVPVLATSTSSPSPSPSPSINQLNTSASNDDNNDNDDNNANVSSLNSDAIAIGTIRSIILGKIENKGTFTAFDITMELRKQGMQVFHRDVKEVVHNMFDNGDMEDYRRTRLDVGGGVKPFLYHPVSLDSYTHRP